MNAWSMIRSLTPQQRTTFLGCFLGWTLDAFDFFLLTFVTTRVAADLHVGLPAVASWWGQGPLASPPPNCS